MNKNRSIKLISLLIGISSIFFVYTFFKSKDLEKHGRYAITTKIWLDGNTKTGRSYKYEFVVPTTETVVGEIFLNRVQLLSTDLNLLDQYYIVYSEKNAHDNLLLLNKPCCDSSLLFQPITEREWSIWTMN